jgi:hypothetical protein
VDDHTVIYAGDGGIRAYDAARKTELWSGAQATAIALSADRSRAAAVYRDEVIAAVYDTASGRVEHIVGFYGKSQNVPANDIFANPNDSLLALNRDGTLLAASFSDGSLAIFDTTGGDDIEIFGAGSGYTRFEGGFHGRYLAFAASGAAGSVFAVVDTEAYAVTGSFASENPFGVVADESGIYVRTENLLVGVHPVTGEQTPLASIFDNITAFAVGDAHVLAETDDAFLFFDKNATLLTRREKEHSGGFVHIAGGVALLGGLDSPVIRIMKYDSHPDASVFAYDPAFAHDEARLGADGKTVMLFSYERFRLYGTDGELIAEVELPNPAHVYDQQFRRDGGGSRLDVVYDDGKVLTYSAADGSLIGERTGEAPDLTLFEEFFTDALRFESPLHGTPAAYDKKSGRLVRELEKDAYLTYVTQTGEYIVAEYVTADGFRYGILMNGKCETLAYLPYLCDVLDGRLIFDYATGDLRETRIHTQDELVALARLKGGA